jgi:uncharacterized protein (DUF2062 family)
MPKKTLKHLAPSPARLRRIRSLGVFGDWIYESNLWHVNRYSASMAFFVGPFLAFLPIPGQMLLAALAAIRLRCNLPLTVGLVWITNPITAPGIFYLAYRVGALIIGVPPARELGFSFSIDWLTQELAAIWQPLLLGCLVMGLFSGSLGYFIISNLWRWRVGMQWRQRKLARALARSRGAAPPQEPDAPPSAPDNRPRAGT